MVAKRFVQGIERGRDGGGDVRGDHRAHWQVPARAGDYVTIVSILHVVGRHELQGQRREEEDHQEEGTEDKHG
jgi:hypothetical protein